MKIEKDYQTADGNVKFELTLVETLSERTTYRYLLNGWVEGFGPRTEEFLNSSHHGPYDCQYWLKGVLPQEVLDTLDRASLGFGGADWQRGMEVMRSVEDRISPSAIAAQIKSILRELGV